VSVEKIPEMLRKWSIDRWYIQRLIPTRRVQEGNLPKTTPLKFDEYEARIGCLRKVAADKAIQCIVKRDRRHNCVFLLAGEGELYTQSDSRGVKVRLGRIGRIRDYFSDVSRSDHCLRYYDILDAVIR
jgi:hypothetical protein